MIANPDTEMSSYEKITSWIKELKNTIEIQCNDISLENGKKLVTELNDTIKKSSEKVEEQIKETIMEKGGTPK